MVMINTDPIPKLSDCHGEQIIVILPNGNAVFGDCEYFSALRMLSILVDVGIKIWISEVYFRGQIEIQNDGMFLIRIGECYIP